MAKTAGPIRAAPFSVLFVCTANLCRSPLAEHLLRDQLEARGLNWTVRSAGVSASPGQPMHASAARVLLRRGVETQDWVSNLLDADMVTKADLILTATEAHRGAVAQLIPTAMQRTFTLLQFAHFASAIRPMDRLSAFEYGPELIQQAALMRGRLQPIPSDKRDLADPMGQSFAKFRRCAATIERSLDQMLLTRPRLSWNLEPTSQPDQH